MPAWLDPRLGDPDFLRLVGAGLKLRWAQEARGDPTVAPAWVAAVQARRRTLHPEQLRFVRSTAKRKVVRAGRRAGKTVGVADMGVAAFLAGRRVLYAVPTQDQMDRFWFEVKRALEPAMECGAVIKNETRHLIELPRTETRIRAKTAFNADTLRGDYADLLILDEFQLMSEDAWGLVGSPMLLDNDGDAAFIYTPPSIRSASMSKARDKRHAAKLFKAAAADPTGRWATFHFTSHANPFLSAVALDEIIKDMSTMAHRQEVLAEDTDDVPGALWTHVLLDTTRVRDTQVPELVRIAIALDPSATSRESADEMGMVAGGVGIDGHGYTLQDASMRGTPAACARAAIKLYDALEADVLVAEVNNGGEWIETVIRFVANDMLQRGERPNAQVHYKMVHASRGKQTRAEPIATAYEHGRIHHAGIFPALEEEMCSWTPGAASPNRMDACLVAGTRILTRRGQVPIEEVTERDQVWTRTGWQRVRHAWQTAASADVQTLRCSDGRTLTGTGNHPVWVEGTGWRPLGAVAEHERLTTWNEEHQCFATVAVSRGASGVAPVYNLDVEQTPEYLANGMLVHNCVWLYTELLPQGGKRVGTWGR